MVKFVFSWSVVVRYRLNQSIKESRGIILIRLKPNTITIVRDIFLYSIIQSCMLKVKF